MRIFLFIALVGIILGAFGITSVSATVVTLPNPLGEETTIQSLLCRIVTWLRDIGGILGTVIILIAAIQMLFAGGSEEKFATAKRTILYTVIGYAIILIGWGIVAIVAEVLGADTPSGC